MLRKSPLVLSILAVIVMPLLLVGQQTENHCSDYLYGLYYGSWDSKSSDLAFVISPDGKPILPKANDPEAPTHSGFYVEDKRFEFAWSKFSPKGFSFRTKSVNGRFGCEAVDVIPEVPYLQGELKETRDGRVMRSSKLHFGHAVVL